MGYTHYWTLKSDFAAGEWKALTAFATRAFEHAATKGVKLAREYDEPGEAPSATTTSIVFNGVDKEGYETFYLVRKVPPPERPDASDAGFAFCKTARKPYDLVACAVLVAARVIAGRNRIGIQSDGVPGEDAEWDAAISFYNEVASLTEQGLVDADVVKAFLREDDSNAQTGGQMPKQTAPTETQPAPTETAPTETAPTETAPTETAPTEAAPTIPPLYVVTDEGVEVMTYAGVMFYYKGEDPKGKPLTSMVSKTDPYYSVTLDLYENA